MLFNSVLFLFVFLPLVWAAYWLCPKKPRDLVLLLASIVFYVWGGREQVVVLLLSIVLNYLLGWSFSIFDRSRKVVFILGITLNLALLVFYKYVTFLVSNLNQLLAWLNLVPITVDNVIAPLGISFFTFHALSYLIDVYQTKAPPQKDPLKLALYLAVFPKILAGPILKYRDAEHQLAGRTVNSQSVAAGIRRFVVGLGKKTLIANPMAAVADKIFAIPGTDLSPDVAWLGIVCFALQIYFDFSGYTDMAVGLGRIFGWEFPENFNFPYISQSVQEFWRRWHISLSTWFRDYLYIPLGGNRCSPAGQYRNLIVVFLLCGLWHGSSWNFILWGLWYGLFLILERLAFGRVLGKAWRPLRHLYALAVIVAGWVLFRADNLTHAFQYLRSLVWLGPPPSGQYYLDLYWDKEVLLTIIIGGIAALPVSPLLKGFISRSEASSRGFPRAVAFGYPFVYIVLLGSLFLLSCMAVAGGTFNPFIYFKF